MIDAVLYAVQALLLLYFVGLNGGYLLLSAVSLLVVGRHLQARELEILPHPALGLEPPITLLAPAYNEEATCVASVRSMLQLDYPEYEVLVINDGSKDSTLEVLKEAFALTPFPEAYEHRLETKRVRAVYHSARYPGLRVIDKENGGKADSLNAGINLSRYPLFCAIDADSILERDGLRKVVRPFLEDPTTVAAGGTIRIANGSRVEDGFMVAVGLPTNLLAMFQIVEYLRAFLFGRMGWSPLNALLIISGAFGVFRKSTVVEVGGYLSNTIGEDMELVVRLHRLCREEGRPYRIVYVPDPVCWTEAPEDLRTLRTQRIRWQRGLGESLSKNLSLFLNPRAGLVGLLAMPFFVVFEWLGPLIEVTGYLYMAIGVLFGFVSYTAMAAFLFVAVGLGIMLSVTALFLEEVSFRVYPRFRQLAALFAMVLLENLGFRQLNSWWRLVGLWKWATQKQGHGAWGEMRRTASWSAGPKA